MSQAELVYRHNSAPDKNLAIAGIVLLVKSLLLLPHLIIIGVLGWLAGIVAYVGYWIVAFTGEMPEGIHRLISIYLQWAARSIMWLAGITDRYPPFDIEASGYPVEARLPRNTAPKKGLAVAGIFFPVKALLALPHFVVLAFVGFAAAVGVWINYWIVAFTGSTNEGIERLAAGAEQWWLRIFSWLYGLTDEYPPFSAEIAPAA